MRESILWTNMDYHEDYCAGHLIEAAVAYYNTTGKRKFLDVAIRLANHIDSTFRLQNRHWVSGHQEIELASTGGDSRSEWFGCACCPSNIARLVESVGNYAYAKSGDAFWVNLFIGSTVSFNFNNRKIQVKQVTNYHWDGKVQISVIPEKQIEFGLYIRIPGWADNQPVPGETYHYPDNSSKKFSLSLNGSPATYNMVNGYAVIKKAWKKGDLVELNLPMPVRRIVAIDEVKDDRNRVAMQRGPLVYCFEHADNEGKAMNIIVPDNVLFTSAYKPELLNGIVVLEAQAPVVTFSDDSLTIRTDKRKIMAIPFYSWANRGEGQMQVWMPRKIRDIRLLAD